MLVSKNVALSCQGFVALPATEVTAVPVLVHRLCVLAIFDGMVVVLRVVDLGDRDLRCLVVVALPTLGRLLHFAHLALGGRVHYTVYVRHLFVLPSSVFCRRDALSLRRQNQLRTVVFG